MQNKTNQAYFINLKFRLTVDIKMRNKKLKSNTAEVEFLFRDRKFQKCYLGCKQIINFLF